MAGRPRDGDPSFVISSDRSSLHDNAPLWIHSSPFLIFAWPFIVMYVSRVTLSRLKVSMQLMSHK